MQPLRFDQHSGDAPLRVSFIPLIDVVLQIICFYLFVSAGVQSYQDNSVMLPTMTADPMKDEQPAAFTVNLLSDGSVSLNGEAIDSKALADRITAAQSEASASGEPFAVAIRADRRQQFAMLDGVLRTCREAHVEKVYVRALAESPDGTEVEK